MTDVRSLLRNERAARHISHPYASYSATGKLECSLCRVPLKSDTEIWNRHLKSPQHLMRAERARVSSGKAADSSAATKLPKAATFDNTSKKRKAAEEDESEDPRKKNKQGKDFQEEFLANVDGTDDEKAQITEPEPAPIANNEAASAQAMETLEQPSKSVDEDEWAAFERDIAKPASPEPPSVLTADATITANPTTATETTTSDQNAETGGRDRRAIEAEAEREDAARALEVEFDEMEDLEERVRRLREKREALRTKKKEELGDAEGLTPPNQDDHSDTKDQDGEDEEEDDDEDADDFDDWKRWR